MNKEIIDYMEAKIAEENTDGFDETLLGLYKKGLVDIEMVNGEPMIQVSQKGVETFMNEIALSFVDTVEA